MNKEWTIQPPEGWSQKDSRWFHPSVGATMQLEVRYLKVFDMNGKPATLANWKSSVADEVKLASTHTYKICGNEVKMKMECEHEGQQMAVRYRLLFQPTGGTYIAIASYPLIGDNVSEEDIQRAIDSFRVLEPVDCYLVS